MTRLLLFSTLMVLVACLNCQHSMAQADTEPAHRYRVLDINKDGYINTLDEDAYPAAAREFNGTFGRGVMHRVTEASRHLDFNRNGFIDRDDPEMLRHFYGHFTPDGRIEFQPGASCLLGDLTADGSFDDEDVHEFGVGMNYWLWFNRECYFQPAVLSMGDFSMNGVIDLEDFAIMALLFEAQDATTEFSFPAIYNGSLEPERPRTWFIWICTPPLW